MHSVPDAVARASTSADKGQTSNQMSEKISKLGEEPRKKADPQPPRPSYTTKIPIPPV